jgi:hypothetical protein
MGERPKEAIPDHRVALVKALQGLQVPLALQGPQALFLDPKELPEKASLVQLALQDDKGSRAPKGLRASKESKELPDKASLAQLAIQADKGIRASPEETGEMGCQAFRGSRDYRAALAHRRRCQDPKDLLDKASLVQLVIQDDKGIQAPKGLRASKGSKELPDRASLAQLVIQDDKGIRANQVARGREVSGGGQEREESLDRADMRDPQGSQDATDETEGTECQVCLEPLEPLEWQDVTELQAA